MCAVLKQYSKRFAKHRPETELIIRNQLMVIIASKLKVKNEVKGHSPQKAHLHPLRDVCVQYENNTASALRNIRSTVSNISSGNEAQTHARHGDDNIPRPYLVGGG